MRWKSDVRVWTDGTEVNGKSILWLTSLGAERGAKLRVRAVGEDAEACMAALEALVRSRFGEEPVTGGERPGVAGPAEAPPAGGR
jgi:phosphocarrier protein